MKKILLIIMLLFLSFAKTCEKRIVIYEYGDFEYHIFQINDEGKIIVPETENRNVVDEYIRIVGLSEQGLTKEILIVPHFIDGIEVREVGSPMWHGIGGTWESEVLERMYVPFPAKINVSKSNGCHNLKKILVLEHKAIGGDVFPHVTNYNWHSAEGYLMGGTSSEGGFCSNVLYMFNYDGAPNDGYYWIDDYDYGTKIKYIPENPVRDGFIFDGWYKEKECINKWDFDVDKLPDAIYGKAEVALYQETILYAKWIKER